MLSISCRSLRRFGNFLAANAFVSVNKSRCYAKGENDDEYAKKKPVISQGVKLYPGHQKSFEEKNSELDAKKLIEDFYGLNELEYDDKVDDGEEAEMDEDLELLSSLRRGDANAVLDVSSVLKLLTDENVVNLCCISIPEDLNYAQYMVIGTCKSAKHINTTFQNFNKVFKKFKVEDDAFGKKSGPKSDKWCAIDIGNVVIHLFHEDYRGVYDLETLWTCGYQYDDKYLEHMLIKQELQSKLEVEVEEDVVSKS